MPQTTEIKLRLPSDMAMAVRTLSGERNQSMNEYTKRAIRNQLIADATHMEAGNILALVRAANEPLTQSANFAAIHAAANLAFLREWAKDGYLAAGLPPALAQEKAAVFEAVAMDEALAAFEDPQIRHQFGWIERPDAEDIGPEGLNEEV